MRSLVATSLFSLVILTGCEYTGPSKPSKPYGLAKQKYENNKDKKAETPKFLKNFIEEDKKAPASNNNTVALPSFKAGYLDKLRAKYPMLKIEKIEDKDLMGMLEIYSQELNKIKKKLDY